MTHTPTCDAARAEQIIRNTGKLVGQTLTVGRHIDCSGATEVSGNWITPNEEMQAVIDAERAASTAAFRAREAERERLQSLGVSLEDAYEMTRVDR